MLDLGAPNFEPYDDFADALIAALEASIPQRLGTSF